jgi:hypothetical protein
MEVDLMEPERKAPIWQPSGNGYDLVPYVNYNSYDEYFQMLRQLKREFYAMVSEFVENALGNSVMNPRSISHYGLLGIWRDMRCKGLELFFKLTKGRGRSWCVAYNAILMSRMDSAARAYFYYHLQPTSDDTLHECKQDLINVMKREVKLFMKHGEFFHDGYYSFTRKNFKCFLSSIDLEHPMEKINFYYLPIAKFQKIMLAFAMGTHHRLGGGDKCLIRSLPVEFISLLFAWESTFN